MVVRKFIEVGDEVYGKNGEVFVVLNRVGRFTWEVKGPLGTFNTTVKRIKACNVEYPRSITLVGVKFRAKNGLIAEVIAYESATKVKVSINGNISYKTINCLTKGEFTCKFKKRCIKDPSGNNIRYTTHNSGEAICLENMRRGEVKIQFVNTGNISIVSWSSLKRGNVFDGDWHKDRPKGKITPLEDTLKAFRETHGERYLYEVDRDVGALEHIPIVCREHGRFFQSVSQHKDGRGCPNCAKYGFRQKFSGYFYIQLLEGASGLFLKYGITNVGPNERMQQTSSKSTFKHSLIYSQFELDGKKCRFIENNLKKKYKGCLTKKDLPDGFSETVCADRIFDVLRDVVTFSDAYLTTSDGGE